VLPLYLSPVLCGLVHLVEDAFEVAHFPGKVLHLGLGGDAFGLVLFLEKGIDFFGANVIFVNNVHFAFQKFLFFLLHDKSKPALAVKEHMNVTVSNKFGRIKAI
jgi:hypothetical protein